MASVETVVKYVDDFFRRNFEGDIRKLKLGDSSFRFLKNIKLEISLKE